MLKLKRKQGTPILELILGKNRPEGRGQYIRFAGEPEVYSVLENINLDVVSENWLNKTILDLDGGKLVKRMELKRPQKAALIFEREAEDKDWSMKSLTRKEKLKKTELDSLSNMFKDLKFEKFVSLNIPIIETGRGQLTHFKVDLFDGRVIKLSLGEKTVSKDQYYYAAVEMELKPDSPEGPLKQEVDAFNKRSKSWLYGLNTWVGKQFLKERSDLIEIIEEKKK